jgi:hypothetical protein
MERRRAIRRVPQPDEPIARVRLRTGRELAVLDVSNAGMCVEGSTRLLPGTHLDVHVVTRDGRMLVRSRVARCHVSALQADVVTYRGALAFERSVDTSGYHVLHASVAMLAGTGVPYPGTLHAAAAAQDEQLSA